MEHWSQCLWRNEYLNRGICQSFDKPLAFLNNQYSYTKSRSTICLISSLPQVNECCLSFWWRNKFAVVDKYEFENVDIYFDYFFDMLDLSNRSKENVRTKSSVSGSLQKNSKNDKVMPSIFEWNLGVSRIWYKYKLSKCF